jgi:hypothetical protein
MKLIKTIDITFDVNAGGQLLGSAPGKHNIFIQDADK